MTTNTTTTTTTETNAPIAKTFIAMIVDETGSMLGRKQTAIDSTNEFINAHKEIPECYASLITFDDVCSVAPGARQAVRFLSEGAAIADVPMLSDENYKPYGMTNLYDAIGSTIAHMTEVTSGQEDPTVIIMINTDGDENSSKEFTSASVKELIAAKTKENWEFIFIAEEMNEQRSRGIADSIGISADMTVNVTSATRGAVFNNMAGATMMYSADASVLGAKGPRGADGTKGDSGVTLKSYMHGIVKGD